MFDVRGGAVSSRRWSGEVSVPGDGPCFEGHFPGNPILPGVLQIEIVRRALQAWRGVPVDVSGVDSMRLRSGVRPGARLLVELERPEHSPEDHSTEDDATEDDATEDDATEDDGSVTFRLTDASGGNRVSHGRLRVETRGGSP